ncbi:hypothetical protein TRAPUB_2464 [Trametes pubescens]|uniref:CHAT domain-containing protein n=1 Tax=Trametes pubescens TaxID=154538 RepID=A0A1M2VGL1_TRAPU|nr:hypothetical protein TRAPUB_2464 [Trametes pubescens]
MPADALEEEISRAFGEMLSARSDPPEKGEDNPPNATHNDPPANSPSGLAPTANDLSDSPASAQSLSLCQAVEPLFKVLDRDAGAEEITQLKNSLLEEHEQFMDQLPVAILPEYARSGLRTEQEADQAMYDAKEFSTTNLKGVADFVTRAMRLIDAVKEHSERPEAASTPPTLRPSTASSSTAPPPDLTQYLSSALNRTKTLTSTFLKAFGGDWVSREMKRALQGNLIYLGSIAMNLSHRLQSTPESSPDYRDLQSSFGATLLSVYELTHDDRHLDAAVGAVSLAFSADAEGILSTTMVKVRNWAYSQRLLARRDQKFELLTDAVNVCKRTLHTSRSLYPDASDNFYALSLELAECLLDRYRAFGEVQDLQDIINLPFASGSDGDMQDVQTLCVLSEVHLKLFLRMWNLDHIDKALFYSAHLSDLDEPLIGPLPNPGTPPHPDAVRGLHVLALVRAQRFKVVMDVEDLDAAVTHARKAVQKCPEDHPMYALYVTDLALILHQRFEADEDIKDLDECVERLGIAAHLPIAGTYIHYPAKAAYGLALASHGEHTEDLREVDEGIRQLQLARRAFPGGAHLEAQIERDLATALFYRFQLSQRAEDLDDAIRYASSALSRAPADDQRRAALGLELGQNLALRARDDGSSRDADTAIQTLRAVAENPGRASIRLDAAMEWAQVASVRGPEATLEALEVALGILPLVAWAGNRMVVQYKTLVQLSADVGPWAAACAIACGRLEDAVAYLERERNVLWSQSLQLRLNHGTGPASTSAKPAPSVELGALSSYLAKSADGLPEVTPGMREDAAKRNPQLAQTVERLRAVYEGMRAKAMAHPAYRPGDFDRIDALKSVVQTIQGDASLHGAAKRWGTLRATLSQLGDDASGLKSSGDLHQNASLAGLLESGDVVFLNAHSTRCDAIVLSRTPDDAVTFGHIPLPGMSVEEIRGWADAIQVGLYDLQQGGMSVRDFDEVVMIPILQGLWNSMAQPVLAHLNQHTQRRPSRVWWCPTGALALLPIHAAGPYDGDAPGLPELVISSYIPTLHSLLRAHAGASESLSMLAIGQPDTPGQNPLPAVHKELTTIQRACARVSHAPTNMVGSAATVHAISSALPAHTWLHFSCHAHQDPAYAFASAFFMHHGPLRLGALIRLDLSRVQFAFLSACLTSAGDERLPDESIHLAAGLQFAGVRSAIATLWTVDDRSAAFIADRVYGHLMREGVGEPDPSDAAEALHSAVGALKAAGRPMIFWVPFIHTGR